MKQQIIKVYKIDKFQYEIRSSNILRDKVLKIINRYHRISDEYKSDNKIPPYYTEYSIDSSNLDCIFYPFAVGQSRSPWHHFLPSELKRGIELNQQVPSFVLFVLSPKEIFAIVGGKGLKAVKRYLDFDFGFRVLSRIAQPDKNIVHSIETRSITGNVASRREFYKNDRTLLDIIDFSRLQKEILFEFNKKNLRKIFGLSPHKNTRVYGLAGEGFQIRLSIDFFDVAKIITKLEEILEWNVLSPLSMFIPLKNSAEVDTIIEPLLIERIFNRLYKNLTREQSEFYDYDFCHPSKLEQFYEADEYHVYLKGHRTPFIVTNNRDEIYNLALDKVKQTLDIDIVAHLMSTLGGMKVRCYKESIEVDNMRVPFLACINCEIMYKSRPLFKIDGKWYHVSDTFITDLNRRCSSLISTNYLSDGILTKTWSSSSGVSEGTYNSFYEGEKGYMVFDKLIVDEIELCDIIHYDDSNLYVIHVKKGFNAKMRDLANQINISARRLQNDLQSGSYSYLTNSWEKYILSTGGDENAFVELSDFISLFSSRNIVFVFAFVTENEDQRVVYSNIESYRSNIAKYSLIQCHKDIKETGYPIKYKQINIDSPNIAPSSSRP